MATKLHIKKGDLVRVIAGGDKGNTGRVLEVMPREMKALVEGVRMVSKHTKPSQKNPNGGIIQQEAPIHVSNLMLIDPATKQPTRIGRKRAEDGKGWVRVSKKSGEIIK
ncbi:MAG: 50S ribosomal protein L24 [Bacteroidia bacterium]|jgi:large subunit ribosomal protein L24|nr:50S ribosomal protein L24 [Bacteroidia bacterium]